MATQSWIRSENFIDTATEESYITAKEIFTQFEANLKSGIEDSDLLEYYTYFEPINDKYNVAYLALSALNSSSPANTFDVNKKVAQLRGTEIRHWDVAIQKIYERGTVNYTSLLPKFRKPFQQGAIEERKNAIVVLLAAIGDDANLASLKIDIQTFLNLWKGSLEKQDNQFTKIGLAIEDLEKERLNVADAMMYIYGKLVSKYYKNLVMVELYFPVDLLQRLTQEAFVATLKNNKVRGLFKRKLDIVKNLLVIKVIGKSAVIGYFTNGLTDKLADGALFMTFLPDTLGNYDITKMGYTDEKRYFYILRKASGKTVVDVRIK